MQDSVLQDEPVSLASALKVPPHSVEAEQSVLGGLMLDNTAWDQIADRLGPEDFYRRDHRTIFRAVAALAESGSPFDVVTLSERLESVGELAGAGGLGYLSDIVRNTPSAANITAYADIVRERSVLRSLIRTGNDIAGAGFNPQGRGVAELLDEAEQRVFQIAESGARNRVGAVVVRELLGRVVDRIDRLYQAESHITGVPTGFDNLDERTAGLQAGDLIIIAGRPSMGKTALAMNLAEHAAIKTRLSVGVFSMEMPAEQLIMRMIGSLGRIDQHRLRTGKLMDEDWPRFTHAVELLSDTSLFIDDSPVLTPMELRARCRRLKREHDVGLVVVDYLQLMQVPGTKENRATEISEISRSLKALAKELSAPVVALSQLNRSVEQRTEKKPVMSDLRESGAIEQDADVILFIYRDEVYNKDSAEKGKAEINIAKQRNGPIGMFNLTFSGQFARFDNYAPDDYSGIYQM
jgi:replicative DNA helicase